VTLANLPNGNARSWIDLDANGAVSAGRMGLLPRGHGQRERHAGDPPGRPRRHDRSERALEVPQAVPQLPSPIIYRDVLYMVNDGGIVTALSPSTGAEIGQGRLKGAIDHYYASPVAADGKIFMLSETGKVVVLPTGGSLEPYR
jgi:hypothetical protein